MRFPMVLIRALATVCVSNALAYVPAKSPSGADRRWSTGVISVQFTGPTTLDGHAVLDGARNAMASWNAVGQSRIAFTASVDIERREPAIGNGSNEFGWVERSDSPYFIPGVPCTTATIYDTLSGVIAEADTTCNAMSYQWPDDLFGLYTQDRVVDAESAALAAFGAWLGLDSSLQYGDPMTPVNASGSVLRSLADDEVAFARHVYGDGTSSGGEITGTVRFADGSPVPFAYVLAFDADGRMRSGAVTSSNGAYTIFELPTGDYWVVARPLTTDPYIMSSTPYRANPLRNLDFSPTSYGGSVASLVPVSEGSLTAEIHLVLSRAGSQPDLYEPNDAPETASPLTLGVSRIATTHTSFDRDWYWFQTMASTCYVVATWFHGASTAPTVMEDDFWSRTWLTVYDGASVVAQNESRDEFQSDPRNWLTICEAGSGRRLDIEVAQRRTVGGAGYFYAVYVTPVAGGSARTPSIEWVYPTSGWSHRNRFVWIAGEDFMPGAKVEIRPPASGWVTASQVVTTGCDGTYRCIGIKALLPPGSSGTADLRVTNPNGRSVTKPAAFTYLANGPGPFDDRTVQAFGARFGQGKAVCIGDYNGDGSDDIFKTRNGSLPHQLFRSNGDGTFADVAASAGLQLSSSTFGQSCSFIDVDDDGDLDLYVTAVAYVLPNGASNALYLNQLSDGGGARFVLGTPPGLTGSPARYKSDAAWADFDRDGRVDVVLAYDSYAGSAPHDDALQYFRQGANGSFADITGSAGLAGYVASVTSLTSTDFNGDGCDDLLSLTYAGVANRLYRGDCRGHFTDMTAASHIADTAAWCSGSAVADFNSDGKPDILCGTYNAGIGAVRPRLWLNNGSGSFTDRAAEAGLHTVARNMDVVLPLDEDDDGSTDVYLGASENGWLNDRKDVLLRNNGGNPPAFTDVTDAAGMYPTTQDGTGQCVAGVDEFYCDRDASAGGVLDWLGDGARDVFVTGGDPDFLQRGADFLWANGRDVLIAGTTSPSNDWIDVALEGANTRSSRVLSNRSGLGARVTVVPRFSLPDGAVPTETQCLQNPLPVGVTGTTREVVAGNRSQSSPVLHFGLGSSLPFGQKRVDCIKVEWPSGLVRAYTGMPANTKVVLAEDVGRMKVIQVVPNNGPNSRADPTTITGLRFDRDVAAVPQVFFGAIPATSVTFVSEHELTVLPPLWQPPGSVDVSVVNTDGQSDTLLAGYTYFGTSFGVRFKDPVPSMLTLQGEVSNNPGFVAARGIERTGVIADGITRLVLEADVGGPGQVRFVLDDDDNPTNAPPQAGAVGAATGLGGGAPLTTVTVPVAPVSGGRYVAHVVYTAPSEFIRSASDIPLGTRPIRVRSTYIDTSQAQSDLPTRTLDLFRVPVLYVHGMWGGTTSFAWPVMNDPRWIIHRADYSATNDVSFNENSDTPPRVIAELRKKINDRGIAGTRFFVIGHSMGAVLFKIYMSGTGAPYARADNFFGGDVYALLSVDAPYFGSYFASYVRIIQSTSGVGPLFTQAMRSVGLPVDKGCMASLDPAAPGTLGIPSTGGTFHAIVGWGGGEMRDTGAAIAAGNKLAFIQGILAFFDLGFENLIVQCDSGDDFIVCTDSQQGGLDDRFTSHFHFQSSSAKAIHFDSICKEAGPSAAVEHLLNTSTADDDEWGHVLLAAPQSTPGRPPVIAEAASVDERVASLPAEATSLVLGKTGNDVAMSWTGDATRLMKSLNRTLAAGACLAISGQSTTDAGQLTVASSAFYRVGGDSLCDLSASPTIASISPASGPAMGGYTLTILGTGFDSATKVKIGAFYASEVVVVNETTVTCGVTPGSLGPALVTVIDGMGRTASGTFTFLDPETTGGEVEITSPAEGAMVSGGSTITVSAVGSGGFIIDRALASSIAFVSGNDSDAGPGFSTSVTVPADVVGPLEIELLAKDAHGHFKPASPVTVSVIAPGSTSLLRLDAEKSVLLFATPNRQLRVFGIYSDGWKREVTHAPGVTYEMDTQDPRKPGYPYNGTGVAVVDAAGVVTAKTKGTTVCRVTYGGRTLDVVVEVAGIRPTVTLQNPGFISWPFQGPDVTYDVVRGGLSGLRATGGNFAAASVGLQCIKNDFVNVTAADTAVPAAGEGFFYLMRENQTRTYDESPFWPSRGQSGQRTGEIDAASGGCP